jgi:hypothetical protein
MKSNKEFEFDCECGCSKLQVSYNEWGDGDTDIDLSHYTHSWGAHAHPVRRGFKQMFKLIWCAITGKEYLFYDMIIPKDRLEEFKKWVAEL